MTKPKTPMTPDRISAELMKAVRILFPPGISADPDTMRREAEFFRTAEAILGLIDEAASDPAPMGDQVLRAMRKEQVIGNIVLVGLTCQLHTSAQYEDTERLRDKIKKTRALIARKGRAGPSKSVDDIVNHYATRVWDEKPWLRKTAHGTAAEIACRIRMNADLSKGDLKKLGAKKELSVSAITKRVRQILQKSS